MPPMIAPIASRVRHRHAKSPTCHTPRSCKYDVMPLEFRSPRFAPIDLAADVPAGQRPVRVCQVPGRAFVCVRGASRNGRAAAVAAMTWDRLLDAYPRPHLVVAWLHGGQRAGEARRLRLDDLKRAAMALKPRGDWAITNANPTEIYIAYDQQADAAQFCTLVDAKPLSPSPQWHSQAAFRFEAQAQRSIMDLLKA